MREQVTQYLERIRETRAAGTYTAYKQSLDYFLAACDKAEAKEVTNDDLQSFSRKRRAAGDGDRTVHNRFLHVVIFLRAAGNANIPKRTAFPRKVERAPEEYSPRQLEQMIASATPAERLLVELFLCSGMRNGELANLQVEDIDFDASVIRIRLKENWRPKSGREREVAIPRWLTNRLRSLTDARASGALVFPNSRGGVDTNLIRLIKRSAARAGITGRVDCHKFRSTAICSWLRAGASLQDAMASAGHSHLGTVQRYLAVANREQRQAVAERAFEFVGA